MVYNVSCCPRALPSQGHSHTHTHTGACALRRSQYMASQGHRQSGAVPSKTLNSPFIDMLGILHQDQQSCFSPCSLQYTHTHTDTYTSCNTEVSQEPRLNKLTFRRVNIKIIVCNKGLASFA